ncbi:MAG: aspartate-semialdehyde dehydrogenase [Planctomycetaceae bacterium]|nr:aspartate-semialdehyde dehydrogenase [Planctomycetaceae bacterium]
MYQNLAVVGATGAVGKIVRQLLVERAFPYTSIKFLASKRSAGTELEFEGRAFKVEELRPEAFDNVDLVIASTPDDVSREFAPWAVERGAVVVDESGAWRMEEGVPLIVPEVNPDAVRHHQGIIASPNCSTTQMVVAMKPLHDAARIRRVIVSTYQATSGAGVAGQRDLEAGTRAALEQKDYSYESFSHPIAFNVIPQIGGVRFEGYTSEEMKMVWETQKIFDDDSIQVCPTCVRVPVSNCHSESILVETDRELSQDEAHALFREASGIQLVDDLRSGQYPMPLGSSGTDYVFVGRVRKDISSSHGLSFWCVSDNLRKGAATNAVQIAELLIASINVVT